MIYDKINNLSFYLPFDGRFSEIIDFLENHNPETLPVGRYDLAHGIYANVSEYEPMKENNCWEIHKKYADLQYVVSGDETIEWAPLDEVINPSEYSDEYDYYGSTETGKTRITLNADSGSFAYFAPCDMHRPGIFRNAAKVKKIVFKIPVLN